MYKNVLLECYHQWRKNAHLHQFPRALSIENYIHHLNLNEEITRNATVFNLGQINYDSFFLKEYFEFVKTGNTATAQQEAFLNKTLVGLKLQLPHDPILLEFSFDLVSTIKLGATDKQIQEYGEDYFNSKIAGYMGQQLHSLLVANVFDGKIAIKSFSGIFTTNLKAPFEKVAIPEEYLTMPLYTFSISQKQEIEVHFPNSVPETPELRSFKELQIIPLFALFQFLKMLQCKNVVSEVVPIIPIKSLPKKQRRRIENRKRLPPEEYRILKIVLPGTKGNIKIGGGIKNKNSTGQTLTSIDIRRGHFKTFTEDRPLFGKVTGTFWWQPISKTTSPSYQVKTK